MTQAGPPRGFELAKRNRLAAPWPDNAGSGHPAPARDPPELPAAICSAFSFSAMIETLAAK
jgi:hypothetical protein